MLEADKRSEVSGAEEGACCEFLDTELCAYTDYRATPLLMCTVPERYWTNYGTWSSVTLD